MQSKDFMRRLARSLGLLWVGLGVASGCVHAAGTDSGAGVQWDCAKVEGKEYVSLESIRKFYGFNKATRTGDVLVLENGKVQMSLRVKGNECLMNGVKFIFCETIAQEGEKVYISRVDLAKLIDPVLRPNFIKNAGAFRTVVLDPGHGGKDAGATNSLNTESHYNLIVASKTKALLESAGYKVVMTRSDDRYLTLQERVEVANQVPGDAIFISIHFNSGGSAARGIETFTLSPPGVAHYGRGTIASDNQTRMGNSHDSANVALATAVHGSILRRLQKNTFDRGIKRARFSVLSGVRHPAILFEGGFVTHAYEARLIDNPVYQDTLAYGIVDAIKKYQFAVTARAETASR